MAALGTLGSQTVHAAPPQAIPLQRRIGEKTTICPYDATGCGFIVAAEGDQVVNIEGDPDHPINRGAACSKGASLSQLRTVDGKLNPRRLTKVLYRRAGATAWEEKTWDWAMEQIARKIMVAEGFARLFSAGPPDGPLPEHYEPWESPVKNLLSGTENDPAFKIWAGEMDKKGDPERYPIIATTYRVSEQWMAGQMTRNLPWLVELMPDMFVEMSQELAAEKGIENGEWPSWRRPGAR